MKGCWVGVKGASVAITPYYSHTLIQNTGSRASVKTLRVRSNQWIDSRTDQMAQTGQIRVTIVTGGNKGIGLAIVRGMCKLFNGDVVLTARNESQGREAVVQLEREGLNPKFHQLDIDSRDSITKIKEFLSTNYEGIIYNLMEGLLVIVSYCIDTQVLMC